MDQQTRWVIFIIAFVAIMVGWTMISPPPPPEAPAPAPSSSVSAPSQASQGVPGGTSAAPSSHKSLPHPRKADNLPVSLVTVETDDYVATFSNQGGVLVDYRLKKYKNRGTQEPIELVSPDPKSVIHVDEDLDHPGLVSVNGPAVVNSHALIDAYRSSRGPYGTANNLGLLSPTVESGLAVEPLPTQAKNIDIQGNLWDRIKGMWHSFWNPPSETRSLGALVVKAGEAQTLTGGDYQVDSLTVENKGKLFAGGKVRIWFSGAVSIQGWAGTVSGKPGDLELYGYGNNPDLEVTLDNGALTGKVYAPGASIALNNAVVSGGLVGGGITIDPPLRPKPFSLQYDPLPGLENRIFQVVSAPRNLSRPGDETELVFSYVDESGVGLEKAFSMVDGSYSIGFKVKAAQKGHFPVSASYLTVELADSLGQEEITGTNARGAAAYRVTTLEAGQAEDEKVKKSQESKEYPAPVGWTALSNQFFMEALIPDNSTGTASARVVRNFNMFLTPTEEDPHPGIDPNEFTPQPELVFQVPELKNGESFTRSMKAFIGPQDYDLLRGMNLGLERVIDFGTFGFISVYMLKLLKWFHAWGHNWGLAILLLSIAVKLLLWYPTHNSYKNMFLMSQKTREMQPKLDAIKRKYADDKQKQSQETMALWQQAGVNPMSGCLPMFLQLPVFYALYATLGHSIELRGANFLWLPDLSLKDPIFVFPLLMGGTMLLQQKVSGQMATQAAGQQKFMMWFFPVFLTFFSFQWPSGLLVYWVVTNLLSMVQQKIVNLEIQKTKKKEEGAKA